MPDEIKKYDEPYISTTEKRPVENAISLPTPKNIEGLYIIEYKDNNFRTSNLNNDVLEKVLNIRGIIEIEHHVNDSGRFSVFFGFGGEGIGSAMSEMVFY